ncbi:MAG: hypothetical protein MUC49_21190 [Raineya sp.]|jgi:hypothetical protein|nr:hypothetical protein [Raineya sp.]
MGLLDFKNTLQQVKDDLLGKPKEELLGNKEKILNQENAENNSLIEFDVENFFISNGKNKLKRYRQALFYDPVISKDAPFVYGMDCNACCTMYFLQSFGLIPPNITRKQFEYLFTVMNPSKEVKPKSSTDLKDPAYNPNTSSKGKSDIKINNDFFKPIEFDIFARAFPNGSESFLRGSSGAIFPHYTSSHKMLFDIMKAFYDLSFKNGYEPLQKYHSPLLRELFLQSEILIKNVYQDLSQGVFNENYFIQGFVIFVGLAHYPPLPGHYCIIVDAPSAQRFEDTDFWVYPADDPLSGRKQIFVPTNSIANLSEMASKIKKIGYLIYPNCAIGL